MDYTRACVAHLCARPRRKWLEFSLCKRDNDDDGDGGDASDGGDGSFMNPSTNACARAHRLRMLVCVCT